MSRRSTPLSTRCGTNSGGRTGCSAPTGRTVTSVLSGTACLHPGRRPGSGSCSTSPKRPRLTGGTFDVYGGHADGVEKSGKGTLDPSGIVKGWAADRAATRLSGLGLDFYLNAGGDVLLRSGGSFPTLADRHRAPGRPTRAAVGRPAPSGAVATSGRTHRGEHIWNPGTGRPARGIMQATVVGPSLVWADVLATATIAGGLGRMDHARWPPGHEVLLVTDDGAVMVSAGFVPFFAADVPVPSFTIIG